MKSSNPFNTGSPVDPNEFIGRADIIKDIFNFLSNERQNTFLVNGVRRIGKTSLLRKIQKEIPEIGYIPVYFDLQDKGELSLPEILFELMQVMNAEIGGSDTFNIGDFEKDYKIFEMKYLKSILSKNQKIVILFDEFDVLGDRKSIVGDERTKHLAYVTFVPYLTKLIEKKLKLKFIFVIGRSVGDMAEYYGPIKKFSQVAELSYFELDESKELITSLTENSIDFPNESIEKIHKITAGYPHFLQCMCSFLFDKTIEKDSKRIDPDEIDQYVFPAVKKSAGALSWFWDGFKSEERVFLIIIANLMEDKIRVTEESILEKLKIFNKITLSPKYINILDKLIKTKILKKVDGKSKIYEIVIPFIQKWILSEHSIESFMEELKKVDMIVKSYLDVGEKLMDVEDYKGAIENFRKVLQRDPENFEGQYGLAYCLNIINENEEEILNEFQKAYDLNPVYSKSSYVNFLREIYKKNNNERYLREILKVEKDDKDAQGLLLNHFWGKWRDEFSNGDFSNFIEEVNSNGWLLENYKTDIENFIDTNMGVFINSEKFHFVLDLYALLPPKLNKNKLFKWYLKSVAKTDRKSKEKEKIAEVASVSKERWPDMKIDRDTMELKNEKGEDEKKEK